MCFRGKYYFRYPALVIRPNAALSSATQLDEKRGMDYLNRRFPMPNLLYMGYKKKHNNHKRTSPGLTYYNYKF